MQWKGIGYERTPSVPEQFSAHLEILDTLMLAENDHINFFLREK
jgi:hypothetical protein